MWKKFKAHLEFYSLAWEEFKRGRGWGLVKAIHRLVKFIIFIIFGVGIYTVAKILFPLLSLLTWIIVILGTALILEILVVHFLGYFHKRKVSELERFKRNVEELSRVRGMCAEIYHEMDEGRLSPTKDTLRYLDAVINQTLNRCFTTGSEPIVNYYEDGLQGIPDDVPKQFKWLELQMSKLERLINEQQSTNHNSIM